MDNTTMRKEVISILVDNQSNVLTRVSSLFGRRGFNIDSLTDRPPTTRACPGSPSCSRAPSRPFTRS